MKLGILTISDSVPKGKREDASGQCIKEILGHFFQEVLYQAALDDSNDIRDKLICLLEQAELIITNGGTGIMPRDNTPEALDGLGWDRVEPLERAVSYAMALKCGPLAGISRIRVLKKGHQYIVALPGKTVEVEAALTEVIRPFFLHHLFLDRIEIKEIVRETCV